MDVSLAPKREVWRGRGAPRKQVPDEIKELANATYRSGKVGTVVVAPDEEDDAKELAGLLTSYANSLGRKMRIQRQDDVMLFELVDKPTPRKKAA
jgi:hypothetical protein